MSAQEPSVADLYWQAEEHQTERRGWHEDALARNQVEADRHGARIDKGFGRATLVLLARPLIELAILIVLLVKL
jgi:hypothetical protein